MVGCRLYLKEKKKADWVSTLLCSKFFGTCVNHPNLRKNEENSFCIDCSIGFCKHCIKVHGIHRRLQICKYVYQDVVRLQDIQNHLDCSKIQTYKINGEKAVHLNPRPQPKDAKPSTKSKNAGSCEACGRYIQDLPNRFCSIACKVSVVLEDPNDQSYKMITFPVQEIGERTTFKGNYSPEKNIKEKELSESSSEETRAWQSTVKPRQQSHKRKGIPHRAPLC